MENKYCKHEFACVKKVPIFQGLTEADLNDIQKITRSRTYKKQENIFHEGEESECLYIVNKGLIKIFKVYHDGKEQVIRILFPGDFFGEFALLQNKEHYASAEALESTIVCFLQKKEFLHTLEQSPGVSYRFILAQNSLLHEADAWVSTLSLMEIEQRLARVLLLFYEKLQGTNGKFILPFSKKDLASIIATTPETLSRRLQSFKNQQLITLSGRREIEIIDFAQLKAKAF